MKVPFVKIPCGPGRTRRWGRRKGREKRKSPKSRARDRVGTGWRSRIGMNSARPIPAERIRCSWEVAELGEVASGEWPATAGRRGASWKKAKRQQVPRCARPGGQARNDNSRAFGRKVGALVMRWKKRKRKSRAPFAAQGKQARPLQGLAGAGRILVA